MRQRRCLARRLSVARFAEWVREFILPPPGVDVEVWTPGTLLGLDALLALYAAEAAVLDAAGLAAADAGAGGRGGRRRGGGWRLGGFGPCPSRVEAKLWDDFANVFRRYRFNRFEVCACAGKGYDFFLSLKDLSQQLRLAEPEFPSLLGDPKLSVFHAVKKQTCLENEDLDSALLGLEMYIGETSCAPGEAVHNLIDAQVCFLTRGWKRGAQATLIAFALLVAAPWADCFDPAIWSVAAQDVLYNAARLAGGIGLDPGGGRLSPAASAAALAWRPAPFDLMPTPRHRCSGAVEFPSGVCLSARPFGGARLLLPPRSSPLEPTGAATIAAASVPPVQLCTEMGSLSELPVVELSPARWTRLAAENAAKATSKLLIVPVACPYSNVWHALFWTIPALAAKRSRGWDREEVSLAIAFEGWPFEPFIPAKLPENASSALRRWAFARSGGHRAAHGGNAKMHLIADPGLRESWKRFFRPILSILSSSDPFVLGPERLSEPVCFAEGVAGFPSLRYEFMSPKATLRDVALYRDELVAAAAAAAAPAAPALALTQGKKDGGEKSERPLQVVVLQRREGSVRWISNLPRLLRALRFGLSSLGVVARSLILEDLPLLEQASIMSHADILVGAHGAGLSWLSAMAPGSSVIEVMPSGIPGFYLCMGGWDHPRNLLNSIYGGLAKVCGQHYFCIATNKSFFLDAAGNFKNFRGELAVHLPVALVVPRAWDAATWALAARAKRAAKTSRPPEALTSP